MKTPITEFDIVFISYDEPNADANWQDLIKKCPWAKRSHGVYGSDAAHKAAAKLSTTDRFITVDADNIVLPEFFNVELDMSQVGDLDVISWAGKNIINGLAYGNGGIKMWPVNVVTSMRSHENSDARDKRAQVDFCWNVNYVQMNNVYSHVYNNASPYQSYRAGFREGCKMSLMHGDVVSIDRLQDVPVNYRRLLMWMNIGADTVNGLWAIYGARLGFYMTNFDRDLWNWRDVRDFKWHDEFWAKTISTKFADDFGTMCDNTGYSYDQARLVAEIKALGNRIKQRINLPLVELDSDQSQFFKEVWTPPSRVGVLVKETDIMVGIE